MSELQQYKLNTGTVVELILYFCGNAKDIKSSKNGNFKFTSENFKIFKGSFKLNLNKGINILVGDNEAGKSTIIEAIHPALTGMLNGRYMKSELTQYIFNSEIVAEYIQSLEPNNATLPLPHILIRNIYVRGRLG